MTNYTFDNKSLLEDGKRFFPVMGEIHYSRYPQEYWKEALLKMKEGGVTIVSSYVIWIHHEEIENQWDWTGCRDLRKFVETIKECGLQMFLRIGPWVHAEVRNGGFPDWLVQKCPDNRTNSQKYFAEVEKLYKEIYSQVKGLLLKDGGPIVGVQIENEYGHCGGLWGAEGEKHMKTLTEIAKNVGFDVPYYTATGWGGAVTAGLLPVMGGYCDAPWDPRPIEIEPSGNFVFTYERNDHNIGSDFGLGEGITFDMEKFPYLTAELGGGLQVANKRRPVASPKDIGGMSLAKMGSGCNLLGYYMYHGGVNPEGKLTTLEENKASGSLNDMSIKNYDFRAPLGEYGEPNGSYSEIKNFAMFARDFGEHFASTDTIIPESNPLKPENATDLRTSVRKNSDGSGYFFVNNYQRHQKMAEHRNTVLSYENVSFPAVDIMDGDYFFLPFNMKIGKALIKTSLATPLCRINGDYVFYNAVAPANGKLLETSVVTSLESCPDEIYSVEGNDNCNVVTLTRADSLNAHKVTSCGKDYLVITDSVLWQEPSDGGVKLNLTDSKNMCLKVYPAFDKVPDGFVLLKQENGFSVYCTQDLNKETFDLDFKEEGIISGLKEYSLNTPEYDCHDLFVDISFQGDEAILFQNGKRLDDSFYVGDEYPWFISLKRFGKAAGKFTVAVKALKKDEEIYYEHPQEFTEPVIQRVLKVTATKVYKREIVLR